MMVDEFQYNHSGNQKMCEPFVLEVNELNVNIEVKEIKTEPADGHVKPKRRERVNFKDEDLYLVCEWGGCVQEFHHWYNFQQHVEEHLNELVGSPALSQPFTCLWTSCGFGDYNIREMARHVNFHSYHTKLKCHAKNILNSENWNELRTPCTTFPKKSPKIRSYKCEWAGCTSQDIDWLQPVEFFRHVYSSHSEKVVRDNGEYPCRWSGCDNQNEEYLSSIPASKFKEHLRSHTKEKLLSCPTCGSMFANRMKFYDHIRRQELQEVTFPCGECGKIFASQRIFKDHARSHLKPFSCSLCTQTCPSPSTLKKHIIYKHTQEKPFSCQWFPCNFRAKTKEDIKSHDRSHKKMVLYCDICEFSCKAPYTLKTHFKEKHSSISITYACHLCDFKAKRGQKLSQHLGSHNVYYSRELSRFIFKLNLQTGHYQLREDMAEIPTVLPSSEPLVKFAKSEEEIDYDAITSFIAVDVKQELIENNMNDDIADTESNNEQADISENELVLESKNENKTNAGDNTADVGKEHAEKATEVRRKVEDQTEVIKKASLGSVYKCKACGKVSNSKNNIRIHIESHLEGVKYECLNCNGQYKTRNVLNAHQSVSCKNKGLANKYKIHLSPEGITVNPTVKERKKKGTTNSPNNLDDLFDYSIFMGSIGQ